MDVLLRRSYIRAEKIFSLLPSTLPDEILSRIIEFLHAFSRLAMLLLMGLISERMIRRRGSRRSINRVEKTRAERVHLARLGNDTRQRMK